MRSIGLRYFNVFGPRQDPDGAYASVIPAWIGALLRGQTAYINGDGRAARDFCYVDNVVQANLLAATVEDPQALDRAYNVAVGEQTSLTELFELVRAVLVKRLPHLKTARAVHREPRRGDVLLSRADTGAAERLLGYEPRVRIMKGLELTAEWYLENLLEAARAA
jgi:UDP-N-acetylglucosamine 4-epimerase